MNEYIVVYFTVNKNGDFGISENHVTDNSPLTFDDMQTLKTRLIKEHDFKDAAVMNVIKLERKPQYIITEVHKEKGTWWGITQALTGAFIVGFAIGVIAAYITDSKGAIEQHENTHIEHVEKTK
jgi:RsiW-degrading membrane proteinase PrsW (M82 family)